MTSCQTKVCYWVKQPTLLKAQTCKIGFNMNIGSLTPHLANVHPVHTACIYGFSLLSLHICSPFSKFLAANPKSVSSRCIIKVSCWQVENQSGLNLLLHCRDDQRLSIARKQSASIFLRYLYFKYVKYSSHV